ncbi:MAG: hypothetical protein BZY88_17480, partial [SAR202 cluster bacterium Io17-Chloro-G9]
GDLEIGCSRRAGDAQNIVLPYEACLTEEIWKSNRRAVLHRPLYYRTRVALGGTTMALASRTGDLALTGEAIRLHRESLELMPHSWPLWNRLAFAYVRLGRPSEALPAIERSLSISGERQNSSSAHCIAGLAHRDLEDLERAAVSLEECIRLRDFGPSAREAHRVLASVYQRMGREDLAETHRELGR